MSLVLNEEQLMLQTAAQEFFATTMPVAVFRAARDANGIVSADRDVWQTMVDMGWSSVMVPESLGGLDFGVTGMGVLCVEAARSLAATPLQTSACLSIQALLLCNQTPERDQLIESLASGDKLACLRTSGESRFVAEALSADVLLDFSLVESESTSLKVYQLDDSEIKRSSRGLIDSRDYAEMFLETAKPYIELELVDNKDARIRFADVGSIMTACELFGIAS